MLIFQLVGVFHCIIFVFKLLKIKEVNGKLLLFCYSLVQKLCGKYYLDLELKINQSLINEHLVEIFLSCVLFFFLF